MLFFFYLSEVNEAPDASEARCPPVREEQSASTRWYLTPFYDLAALICSTVLYFLGEGSLCSPKDCCVVVFQLTNDVTVTACCVCHPQRPGTSAVSRRHLLVPGPRPLS